MKEISSLMSGYRTFRREIFPANRALYRDLAAHGQSPKVMVVSCCDSRVDPATIFAAGPGDLFMVRNVANLVPPYEPHGDYHGTSAALEFAVTGLEVEHVVVLGHAFCGGVKAFLDGFYGAGSGTGFITKWMSMLRPAVARAQTADHGQDERGRQRALEQASIINSLANLETFPFVKTRIAEGHLRLHGAYFDMEPGLLLVYDPEREAFAPLEPG